MKAEPIVSVVVPAYNAEDTIEECLRSIFSAGSRSVECLVVDDGSIDATSERTLSFARAHPDLDLRLVRQENFGVSIARNRGIEEAAGRWITFVDADDALCSGWEQVLLNAATEYPGSDVIVFSRSAERGWIDPADCLRGCLSSKKRPGSIARSALCCPFAKAYANTCLSERIARFPAGIRTGEDMLFNAALYAANVSVAAWPESIYLYRKQMGSATNRADAAYLQNEASYHRELARILNCSELDGEERKNIVLENCLGGILGVVMRSPDAEASIAELLGSEFGTNYREALERLAELEGCFSKYQVAALCCVATGHSAAASRLLVFARYMKNARYRLAGGVVEERI